MSQARKERGRGTERLAAAYYRERLWPQCEAVAPSLPGRDLLHTPGFAPEIKARRGFNPGAWLRQAVKNSEGDIPFTLLRLDGWGPETIDDWPILIPNRYLVQLIKEAGYGRTEPTTVCVDGDSSSKADEAPQSGRRERLVADFNNTCYEVLEGGLRAFLHSVGPPWWDVEVRLSPRNPSEEGWPDEAEASGL